VKINDPEESFGVGFRDFTTCRLLKILESFLATTTPLSITSLMPILLDKPISIAKQT
jgi:hypothetical protein